MPKRTIRKGQLQPCRKERYGRASFSHAEKSDTEGHSISHAEKSYREGHSISHAEKSYREGHGFSRAEKSRRKAATTLPEAGAKSEGRSD